MMDFTKYELRIKEPNENTYYTTFYYNRGRVLKQNVYGDLIDLINGETLVLCDYPVGYSSWLQERVMLAEDAESYNKAVNVYMQKKDELEISFKAAVFKEFNVSKNVKRDVLYSKVEQTLSPITQQKEFYKEFARLVDVIK
jgi:hypothetical protein